MNNSERRLSQTELPHTALVKIDVKVYDQLESGELSGRVVHKDDTMISVSGETKAVCLAKLGELLDELRRRFK